MSTIDHTDIQDLVTEIERAEIAASDAALDVDSREAALRSFIVRKAGKMVELLNELMEWRDNYGNQGGDNMFEKHGRVIVEGFSDESAAEALSDALNKSVHYFSELHDVSMTLNQLTELRNGGHRAVLELHITPLTNKDRAHVVGLDVELKKHHEREFREQIKREETQNHHLVFDHFVGKIGPSAAAMIPDHLLINVNDAFLMNYMIGKAFLKAGHDQNQPEDNNNPHPSQIRVRKVSEAPEAKPR